MELKILALDCATATGWATNCAGGVESGVQRFDLQRGSSPGMRFLEFRLWLRSVVETFRPEVVVYEQAHHRGGAATELGVGMATRVMEVASELGTEYRACHTATLKAFACENGSASKEAMIRAAQHRFGRKVADDNEADALLLLAWALAGFPQRAGKMRKRAKARQEPEVRG